MKFIITFKKDFLLLSIITVMFICHPSGMRAIEGPVPPSAPKLSNPGEQNRAYRVVIQTSSGKKYEGMLRLPSRIEIIHTGSAGKRAFMQENISNISEIVYRKWQGSERRSKGFVFTAVELEIILKNSNTPVTADRIPSLDRFILETSGGNQTCYSYFYDYYVDGKWKNSGSTDKDYPERQPHPDTVVKITFNETETAGPLGELLRFLSK